MVQTSFFVALAAMVSIAGSVIAFPVQVHPQNLDARDEFDHLEARMFKKLAQEIGYVGCRRLATCSRPNQSNLGKKFTPKVQTLYCTVLLQSSKANLIGT